MKAKLDKQMHRPQCSARDGVSAPSVAVIRGPTHQIGRLRPKRGERLALGCTVGRWQSVPKMALPWDTATPRASGPLMGGSKPGSHQGEGSMPCGSNNCHHVLRTYSVTGTSPRAFTHHFAEPPRLGPRLGRWTLCCPYHPNAQASQAERASAHADLKP